jgi:hypothetical protein
MSIDNPESKQIGGSTNRFMLSTAIRKDIIMRETLRIIGLAEAGIGKKARWFFGANGGHEKGGGIRHP